MLSPPIPTQSIEDLLTSVRKCTLCEGLPLGPLPILQASQSSRILVAGQAPGSRTHAKGIPFDDPSGDRLRQWLGISRDQFYNPEYMAVVPMGFCYPGTGKSGDFPPRPECAAHWRQPIMDKLPNIELKLVIGSYALEWHLGKQKGSLTEIVRNWEEYWPEMLILPHPSPRNNLWLRKNPWFEEEILPRLKERVAKIFAD